MARIDLGFVTGVVVLLLTSPGYAQDESAVAEGIEQCRTIVDTVERLACYDSIGKQQVAPAPPPAATRAPAPAPEARVDSMPEEPEPMESEPEPEPAKTAYGELADDVGLPKAADEYKPIPVTVVRCAKANNRKWYFYFDNDQVWQYLGARTLRYRNCDTTGTLIEDGMGFALTMDGDKTKLRVKRVR